MNPDDLKPWVPLIVEFGKFAIQEGKNLVKSMRERKAETGHESAEIQVVKPEVEAVILSPKPVEHIAIEGITGSQLEESKAIYEQARNLKTLILLDKKALSELADRRSAEARQLQFDIWKRQEELAELVNQLSSTLNRINPPAA